MPFGMGNVTAVTLDNLTAIGNSSSFTEFMIRVNNIVYEGWYVFFMLLVLWIIISFAAQAMKDQPLNNAMYGGAIITVISFLLRGIFIMELGVYQGLLTDYQLWIFPLVTIFLATVLWAIKD